MDGVNGYVDDQNDEGPDEALLARLSLGGKRLLALVLAILRQLGGRESFLVRIIQQELLVATPNSAAADRKPRRSNADHVVSRYPQCDHPAHQRTEADCQGVDLDL